MELMIIKTGWQFVKTKLTIKNHINMKISEIISLIIKNCCGKDKYGNKLDRISTSDKILYGNDDIECTGIIVTCFANIKVIEEAHRKGCNFIITHESIFWNHGDRTDWLQQNSVFLQKKALLDQYTITIWRFHDFMHAGLLIDNHFSDGIYYGLMKSLGWEQYLIDSLDKPLLYKLPKTPLTNITAHLMKVLNLNGLKIIGNNKSEVETVLFAEHCQSKKDIDCQKITKIENENIDLIIPLEIVDYSIAAYVRDACLLQQSKTILIAGHFNIEEAGMKYLPNWLKKLFPLIYIDYVQSGDMYNYIINQSNTIPI